jgi:hypothetical protein
MKRGAVLLLITTLQLQLSAASNERPRFAFCLTGQLARLELASKISRVFEPNLRAGIDIDVFAFLDSSRAVKASRPKAVLGTDLYSRFTAPQLQTFLTEYTRAPGPARFRAEVVLDSRPEPYRFARYGDVDPLHPLEDDLTADQRFQLNFAMLKQLRSCLQLVQAAELRERSFFDYVVRLRDDSVAFADWALTPQVWGESLVDVAECSWGAINDHTFVVARRFADAMFRGPVEDYYLENKATKAVFGTSEVMLLHVALFHKVPLLIVPVCQMPLVPLRGLANATHWKLHYLYVHHYLEGHRKSGGVCETAMLHDGVAPLSFPDSVSRQFLEQRFAQQGGRRRRHG